jgi:hypothetical protein
VEERYSETETKERTFYTAAAWMWMLVMTTAS